MQLLSVLLLNANSVLDLGLISIASMGPRASTKDEFHVNFTESHIAPDKDWRQLGIYPPLFDLIGYFKF